MTKTFDLRWVESFLCAGSSAWLISAAHVYPKLWCVSLFALVPFLWRAIRVSLLESVILGGMLGLAYAFVSFRVESWVSFGDQALSLTIPIFLFAIYAGVVNRIKKHLGFNAVFIAALWLPLDYVISQWVNWRYLFAVTPDQPDLVLRLGSLFGLLMVSFTMVVVNALILISVRCIARARNSRALHTIPGNNRACNPIEEFILERSWFCFPDVRAPPGKIGRGFKRGWEEPR